MSFLTKIFGARGHDLNGAVKIDNLADGPDKLKIKPHPDGIAGLTKWRTILVPAFERPYSKRCLAVASRLAKGAGGTVLLSYLIEVPRTFSLDADQPEEELIAEGVLADAEAIVRSFHVPVKTTITRTRTVRDGIIKLIQNEEVDLLVLGRRHDDARGILRELATELFEQAPCEVIVDFVAGQNKPHASEGEAD
jgi:nucleotide-binding universal stress UspA family protein